MIRRLIILLLIVGNLFADTIVYKIGDIERTLNNIEFTKAGDGKIFFIVHGQEVSRECNQVIEVTDANGDPIDYDCNKLIIEESLIELTKDIENKTTEKEVRSIINASKKFSLGGIFITIGAALLMTNVDIEKSTDHDLNSWNDRQRIGYGLILLGGMILAISS